MFQTNTLNTTQVTEFVAQYNEGKATLATVAAAIGCSVPTAGRLLKKNGANMRSKGRPKGSKTVNRKTSVASTQLKFSATVANLPMESTVETHTDEKPAASAPEGFLAFQQRVLNYNS